MKPGFGWLEGTPYEALLAVRPGEGSVRANRACRELLDLPEDGSLADYVRLLADAPLARERILRLVAGAEEPRGVDARRGAVHVRYFAHPVPGEDLVLVHAKDQREVDELGSQLAEYAEALMTNFYNLEVAERAVDHAVAEKSSVVQAAIEVVAMTLEMSDRYTYGHSRRVAALARRIAQAGELPERELETIRRAALLHDIGKLGVISDILRKPAPLDETERLFVEKHPRYGHDLLVNLPDFAEIAEIVHCHHEHWDGTGYPRGLAGAAIPLAATVISCADAFDAICTNRPYRVAHGVDFAFHEIDSHSGGQFNPVVVDWFHRIPAAELANLETQWQHI